MKNIHIIIICLFFSFSVIAQERFLTKNGAVTFFSDALVEDIKADNNQVLSIIDTSNGKMAITILMKSFMFEKALMQEHFNENYIESDKYPKATFQGEIADFKDIEGYQKEAKVAGKISIHGVTKPINVTALITKTAEGISMKGEFELTVANFNIKIPSVVRNNIAKKVKVNFELDHKPYK